MNAWVERKPAALEAWQISSDKEASENERAYLLNDIGPLFYVFNDVAEELQEEVVA